jgi:hypothetical protein
MTLEIKALMSYTHHYRNQDMSNPNNKQQSAPVQGKELKPTSRKHYSISFSLSTEIIEALNEKVGGTKGARSEFASRVLAKALGI